MKEPAKYLIAEGAIKEFLRRETVLDFSRKKKGCFVEDHLKVTRLTRGRQMEKLLSSLASEYQGFK